MAGIEVDKTRQDFTMLKRSKHCKPLLYLDNPGSSLKLRSVPDRHRYFYEFEDANTNEENILSQNATKAVEDVRSSFANLPGANGGEDVAFLRSATEAMNVVPHAFERSQLQPGDEIVVTEMEHDSNLLPWQIACERSGAKLPTAPVESSGESDLDGLEKMLSEQAKAIAVAHEWKPVPKKFEAGTEAIAEIDCEGTIVRSGTRNTRISMRRLAMSGTVRAAFTFYNTEHECDRLCESPRRLS